MNLAIPALFWIGFAATGACVAYLALLTLASFLTPAASKEHGPGAARFAILVPAHNEEGVIAGLLQSLAEVDYPEERRRVFVVADNCTDATAAVGRQHGATIFERANLDLRGKGYALGWLLGQVYASEGPFDAFVIFDADSRVDPAFLRVMEAELARGHQAIQGHYAVLNPGDGAGAALRGAAMALINFVRPLGKNAFGGSVSLKGNGMCFAAAVIDRFGWSTHSLAEDAEYGVRLLLSGVPVRFAPGARVCAQMPPHVRQSESQNMRWEAGRLLVVRQLVPRLLSAGLRRRSLILLEAAFDLVVPPLSVLAGGVALLGAAALLLPGLAGSRPAAALLAAGLGWHVLAGLARARVPGTVWRALLLAPAYCVWKVLLYGKALARRTPSEWVRTRRFP